MSVAFALFASFGIADAQTAIPAQECYGQVAAQLQRLAEHEVSEKHLPGLSLALVDDQQIVWAQGFGFSDPDKKIAASAETVYRRGVGLQALHGYCDHATGRARSTRP
jgi:CubicO group peptidase (beta-lactamase class C family)